MSHDDSREQTACLHALGLLSEREATLYRASINGAGDDARHEDAMLHESLTLLALDLAPVAPPPEVRTRILADVRSTQQIGPILANEGRWSQLPIAGVTVKQLSIDPHRNLGTLLMRLEPNAIYPAHRHHGPEECYVVSGQVRVGTLNLQAGDFLHADAGSEHGNVSSPTGCTLLLVVDLRDCA